MDLLSYIRSLTPEELASRIDQTMLVGTPEDATKFALESSKYPFRSLVGHPFLLKYFKEHWKGRLTAVVNFPYGLSPLKAVEIELQNAWDSGAVEVDFVASPYILKEDVDKYKEYIRMIVGLAKAIGFDIIKVIVEAPLLSDEELIMNAKILKELKVDFLKTSTGVLSKTTHRDVYLVKKAVPSIEIKASGGIREPIQAASFIVLGASVIGSSTGIQIVEEFNNIKKRVG